MGLLGRPVRLQWRGRQLHLVLMDRRRSAREHERSALESLRAELRARLLGEDETWDSGVMRHLVVVHDTLGHGGWAAVGDLPGRVLRKSAAQAQLLVEAEDSPTLRALAERLLVLRAAAELREERQGLAAGAVVATEALPPAPAEAAAAVEIGEATHEDFQTEQHAWVGTVPQRLAVGATETG